MAGLIDLARSARAERVNDRASRQKHEKLPIGERAVGTKGVSARGVTFAAVGGDKSSARRD